MQQTPIIDPIPSSDTEAADKIRELAPHAWDLAVKIAATCEADDYDPNDARGVMADTLRSDPERPVFDDRGMDALVRIAEVADLLMSQAEEHVEEACQPNAWQTVTLRVPFRTAETNAPEAWNWTTLADSAFPIEVTYAGSVETRS